MNPVQICILKENKKEGVNFFDMQMLFLTVLRTPGRTTGYPVVYPRPSD